MNRGQGAGDHLFGAKEMAKVGAGVMRAGIAITFIIYWIKVADKWLIRDVKAPLHRIDGTGAGNA